MWVFLSTRHAAHTLDGRTDCWIWKKKRLGFLDICAHGWRRSICSKKKRTNSLNWFLSCQDSGVTLHFRVWKGKKTSFLFCVVWPSSLNAGRNGTRRDCATTIWNFFFLFFLSPTEFLKSKRNNTRKWEKIKKRISSCFYGPDVSGLSIPCVRLGDGIFFYFFLWDREFRTRGPQNFV